MPELPEVEVTRQRLVPTLVGRTIKELVTSKQSYFFLTPPRELERRLLTRRVDDLRRHGKYLIAVLDDGSSLLLHLGMTGQLFTRDAHSPRLLRSTGKGTVLPEKQAQFRPDEHTHLCFRFADGGQELLFRDVRKFGKVRWLAAGQREPRLERLGPDALLVDGAMLRTKGTKRTTPIKSLLLDQSVVAGVGNIYADEALFLARVRPARPAKRLTRIEYERLATAIVAVLRRSIETGGSSINDYILPDGSDGGFQREHHVYGRTGAPCDECNTPVLRVVIATRSSHYCPRCQH